MPWESAIDNLDFFYLMFDRSEVYGPLQVSTHRPPQVSRPVHISITALFFTVFPLDLPQESGDAFVPALQKRNQGLDKRSSGTHGPVSRRWTRPPPQTQS